MQIVWTARAKNDLSNITSYINANNPVAARHVKKTIMLKVSRLADQPYVGRPGCMAYTREFVIPNTPYIIVYQAENNVLQIVRILHGKQQWPRNEYE